MKKTSILIDNNTRKQLDDYCDETGSQLSDAIRTLVRLGLEKYQHEQRIGFKESVGPEGLMVNEKRAIRASIESTLLLRELVKVNLKDQKRLDEIDAEVSRIMKEGWLYDNKS